MSFCDEHGTSDGCPDCITLGLEEENKRMREALEEIANPGEKYTFAVYKTMLERAELIAQEALK